MSKTPQPIQKRKYAVIWETISATPVGQVTQVRVHKTAAATLIQAVSKEKSRETADKKRLGMPFAEPLKVATKEVDAAGYQIVEFSLEWDGRRL